MRRITVIGSESFLAKNLIKYLTEYKEIEAEINCYDYKPESEIKKASYRQIDFSDRDSIKDINFMVDTIFIFVGKTGNLRGFEDYQNFVEINEVYLLNLLAEYVESKSIARIIYPSSRLVFKSDTDHLINEDCKKEPRSVYAVTKIASEGYLSVYHRSFNIDYVVLRICTPFGSIIDSEGNYGTFEIFRNQARIDHKVTIFGDGNDRKTYTDIRDVCEAFCRLMVAKHHKFSDYNLGGQNLTMNQAVSYIVSDLNADILHVEWPQNYRAVDGGTVMFDSSRFDNEFGMRYHDILSIMQ